MVDHNNHQDENCSCTEYKEASRRRFMSSSKALAAAALTAPLWLPRVAKGASPGSGRDVYVQVFLRGGIDGLTLCVPYGDSELYNWRPTIAIPPPGQTDGAIDLDGFFGLPQAASPLMTPWNDGALAVVHATGSTDESRSHFDAERFLEFAIPEFRDPNVAEGWLARHLEVVPPVGSGSMRGMAIGDFLPYTMMGGQGTVPVPRPEEFSFPGDPATAPARRQAVDDMYSAFVDPLKKTALNTLETIDLLESIDFENYQPENGANYPLSFFGLAMMKIAAIIKADIGVESLAIDYGGWDTHSLQGPINGYMATIMGDLTASLEAFYLDMALSYGDKYTLVGLSEFGRRVEENAGGGTDHGHGNCMLVMGGNVNGGQVYGTWPGLALNQLDLGLDLAITTDYRLVLGEILVKRLLNTSTRKVFPRFRYKNPLGIVN